MSKPTRGRAPMPDDERQSEFIKERVTQAVKAAYVAKGGKAALLRWVLRKARK